LNYLNWLSYNLYRLLHHLNHLLWLDFNWHYFFYNLILCYWYCHILCLLNNLSNHLLLSLYLSLNNLILRWHNLWILSLDLLGFLYILLRLICQNLPFLCQFLTWLNRNVFYLLSLCPGGLRINDRLSLLLVHGTVLIKSLDNLTLRTSCINFRRRGRGKLLLRNLLLYI